MSKSTQMGNWERIETGDILLNENGEAGKQITKVYGEIVAVKVEYGENPSELTTIKIITSMKEEFEYLENNEDFVEYPRKNIAESKFHPALKTGELLERHVNCGDLYIVITRGEPNTTIKNITIIVRN